MSEYKNGEKSVFDADKINAQIEKLEYAKEVAIDFFKWYAIKMHTFIEYIKDIRPLVISDEIEKKVEEFEGKSIDTLFELYLQSLTNQK